MPIDQRFGTHRLEAPSDARSRGVCEIARSMAGTAGTHVGQDVDAQATYGLFTPALDRGWLRAPDSGGVLEEHDAGPCLQSSSFESPSPEGGGGAPITEGVSRHAEIWTDVDGVEAPATVKLSSGHPRARQARHFPRQSHQLVPASVHPTQTRSTLTARGPRGIG